IVQRCAMSAWRGRSDFAELLLRDPAIRRSLSPATLRRCLEPRAHLKHVNRIFKRVGL
ncbi:MAG: adenylosuccinate lyase, partial [Candidatus Omnitrophica bacterium]|nr:adenylosuccinate lyase [Candidatus Omnitrophota bacterium]